VQLADVLELAVRHGIGRFVEKRAGVMLPLAVGAMIPSIVHKAIDRARSTEHTLDHATGHPFKVAASIPRSPQYSMPFYNAGIAKGQRQHTSPMSTPGGSMPVPGNLLASLLLGTMQSNMGQGFAKSTGGLGGAPIGGLAKGVADVVAAPGAGVAGGISEMIKRKMLGKEFGEKKDPFHMGAGAAIQTFGKEMGTSGANLLRDIATKAMEAAGHAGDASARTAIIGDLKKTDSVLANADDATLMEAYHTMSRFAPVLSTDKNAVRSFLRQAVMSGSGPDYMSIKLLADSERAVTGEKDR
jgi:hypothetical protein